MTSEKRYNLERNKAFNGARSSADRKAYRAMLKTLPNPLTAEANVYLAALFAQGNKSASFPSYSEWAGARIAEGRQ